MIRPVGLLYLDSSALVKLIVSEQETPALLSVLRDWPERVSSELALVEVGRAARRASNDPAVHRRAQDVLDAIHLLRLDVSILQQASRLQPAQLRSLDAIHLASALSLEGDLGALAAYDGPLRNAARALGVPVVAPG
ncbi:MAG TPA: type II toxin-antitoxin system VapC family toxin [Thermoanaerobaculia bacterium]|nr:type II toxin-antitoxin system VapC family toxin [Thermoanaerobaculia bacterium]